MSLRQVAVALDQLINTLAGGWADETLSARAWRLQRRSRVWNLIRRAIDGLFFWQTGHCFSSWLAEENRRHFPVSYRL